MKTTAIEPGKDSWRIEELESMDPLQAAKISLAMFAGTTMALAKQGRRVECAIAMNASNRFRYAALTPEQKAERSAKKKAVRAAWRAAGLCTRCGRKREDKQLLTCEHCRKKDKRGGKRTCKQ